MGLVGFEPTTSPLSGARSKPTELQARRTSTLSHVFCRHLLAATGCLAASKRLDISLNMPSSLILAPNPPARRIYLTNSLGQSTSLARLLYRPKWTDYPSRRAIIHRIVSDQHVNTFSSKPERFLDYHHSLIRVRRHAFSSYLPWCRWCRSRWCGRKWTSNSYPRASKSLPLTLTPFFPFGSFFFCQPLRSLLDLEPRHPAGHAHL